MVSHIHVIEIDSALYKKTMLQQIQLADMHHSMCKTMVKMRLIQFELLK